MDTFRAFPVLRVTFSLSHAFFLKIVNGSSRLRTCSAALVRIFSRAFPEGVRWSTWLPLAVVSGCGLEADSAGNRSEVTFVLGGYNVFVRAAARDAANLAAAVREYQNMTTSPCGLVVCRSTPCSQQSCCALVRLTVCLGFLTAFNELPALFSSVLDRLPALQSHLRMPCS